MKQLFRMAALGCLVLLVVMLAKLDPGAIVPNKRDQSLKRWMKIHVTDPKVEMLGFSESRMLWDRTFQVGWIRGKNPHDVTVMSIYVFEVTTGQVQEIVDGWSSRDFIALKQLELQGMSPNVKGQKAGELQRFCNEMGIPIERET
jgi:hypothetical protein